MVNNPFKEGYYYKIRNLNPIGDCFVLMQVINPHHNDPFMLVLYHHKSGKSTSILNWRIGLRYLIQEFGCNKKAIDILYG